MKFYNPATNQFYASYDDVYLAIVERLGPAERHLKRIRRGELKPTDGVLDEIGNSIYDAKLLAAQMLLVADNYVPPAPKP